MDQRSAISYLTSIIDEIEKMSFEEFKEKELKDGDDAYCEVYNAIDGIESTGISDVDFISYWLLKK